MKGYLMALVIPPDATPEAGESEPVVIAPRDDQVVLALDDGSEIVFDRDDLIAELQEMAETWRAA